MRIEPVFLFDLDGTLVDSVYQHGPLHGRRRSMQRTSNCRCGRIHRKIGMSGRACSTNQLLRETGIEN